MPDRRFGTGKSHLLIALGTEAAMAGFRVRYTLATKLVNELVEAADDRQLTKTINRYGRAATCRQARRRRNGVWIMTGCRSGCVLNRQEPCETCANNPLNDGELP